MGPNRFYFDYNATSPLADRVQTWLTKGDFPFGNPSSIHTSGKQAKREIARTSEYLRKLFGLKNDFRLIYHSGATEGVNSILQGFFRYFRAQSQPARFCYFTTDHSCVRNCAKQLASEGVIVEAIKVNSNGDFSMDEVDQVLSHFSGETLLNMTLVNNETGVHWPLDLAQQIKKKHKVYIHIDAVQSIGKISNWQKLAKDIDAYTFSGHKFGALKGIGMSFIQEQFPMSALFYGGGQQSGLRSGTENTLGIASLKLALEEVLERQNISLSCQSKVELENKFSKLLSHKGHIICRDANHRNCNTIQLILPGNRADVMMAAFDMQHMDVSSGSACGAGSVKPGAVLLALGHSEDDAKCALRFSFTPYLNPQLGEQYFEQILPVLKKFIDR